MIYNPCDDLTRLNLKQKLIQGSGRIWKLKERIREGWCQRGMMLEMDQTCLV